MITRWGYSVTQMDGILTVAEFDELTADRYKNDVRTQPLIDAAVDAVRDSCGWHVCPSKNCELSRRAHDLHLIISGRDTIIQLPATFVTSVTSVLINGEEVEDFSFEVSGLLRVYDFIPASRKDAITVNYTAGISDASAVKELVAHRVTHGLAQSYGIQSEAAGGVSITYSANWINSARATALPDDNKAVLAPYRLQGVF